MRETKRRSNLPVIRLNMVLALMVILALGLAEGAAADRFTDTFRLQDCSWSVNGTNPFFKLRSGYQIVIEGEDEGAEIRQEITVLREFERITLEIDGVERTVRTRVVEEREFEDGEIVEISRNFYARCRQTNDVYYFGEDSTDFEDGEPVSTQGTWKAGQNGARPGIIMPGTFLKGARYYQEYAPEDEALDRAQNAAMGLTIETALGTFTDCVGTIETTPLDPESEGVKAYCPGVGIVMDEELMLTEINQTNR